LVGGDLVGLTTMPHWTISWQEGSGGEVVARLLAQRAGVPLVDAETVAEAVEREFDLGGGGGRLLRLLPYFARAAAPVFSVVPDETAIEESPCPSRLEMTESVILEAARSPCVVADCSAFAILAEHPSACHARIRAPLEWRIKRYASENCLSWEVAKRAVVQVERQRQLHLRRAYGRLLDSVDNFTVVFDASRFALDDLVGALLAWGRRGADQLQRA
jgi:cytidylate kinase